MAVVDHDFDAALSAAFADNDDGVWHQAAIVVTPQNYTALIPASFAYTAVVFSGFGADAVPLDRIVPEFRNLRKLTIEESAVTKEQLRRCVVVTDPMAHSGQRMTVHTLVLRACNALTGITDYGSLESLSVIDCTALTSLPASIWRTRRLAIVGCPALAALPNVAVSSSGARAWITSLYIDQCSALTALPGDLRDLRSLHKLELVECTALSELPELPALGCMSVIRCTALARLPESMGALDASLKALAIENCSMLAELPMWIGSLQNLNIALIKQCPALTRLPESMGDLPALQRLGISHCNNIVHLPASLWAMPALASLGIIECHSLRDLPPVLDEHDAASLLRLMVFGCPALRSLSDGPIAGMRNLMELDLRFCVLLEKLPSFHCNNLRELNLGHCSGLVQLPLSLMNIPASAVIEADGPIEDRIRWMQTTLSGALRVMLTMIVAGRKSQWRMRPTQPRLPPELWRLIFTEFIGKRPPPDV